MQIEFDSSLITLHLQQKVDTQREQANYTMACPACRNTSLVSCQPVSEVPAVCFTAGLLRNVTLIIGLHTRHSRRFAHCNVTLYLALIWTCRSSGFTKCHLKCAGKRLKFTPTRDSRECEVLLRWLEQRRGISAVFAAKLTERAAVDRQLRVCEADLNPHPLYS